MTVTYFSSQQESILRLVTLGSATVSLACSLVVIVTYYLLPHLRTFRNRIVLFICIADIILNISLIGGSFASGSQVACKCFAVVTNFSFLAMSFWSLCLVIALHRILCSDRNVGEYERYFHMLGWGAPVLITTALCVVGVLGWSGGWCWVHPDDIDSYRWVYVPLLIATVVAIVLVGCTYHMLVSVVNPHLSQAGSVLVPDSQSNALWKASVSELLSDSMACEPMTGSLGATPNATPHHSEHLLDYDIASPHLCYDRSAVRTLLHLECATSRHYLWYTVTFVFVATPCYINHFYYEFTHTDGKASSTQFILALLQALSQPLHGLFTFVVFSLNKPMMMEYRRLFSEGRQPCPVTTAPAGLPIGQHDKVEVGAMQLQLQALQEQIALLQQAKEAALMSSTSGGTTAAAISDLDKAVSALKEQSLRLEQQLTLTEMSSSRW